jgi:D-arginine dehydrogenase
METCDVLIVGAGIAGASAGYFLAPSRRVIVLEREGQPGYHATGRSAAMFTETYGNARVRALTRASRAFMTAPPAGFSDVPLVHPRGCLIVGRADQRAALDRAHADYHALVESVRRADAAEARAMVPALRADYVAGAVFEPEAMDIDVNAVHRGFLRGLARAGGRVVTDAEVTALRRADRLWRAETPAGAFAAPVLVDAAGAWCDELAALAGVAPIGLVPKRRTVITFDPPAGLDFARWPIVIDVDERFYFRPEAGRILATPADETPMPPCDVQPEEIDIAELIERLQAVADLPVRRIAAKWAGLRSFVADKTPVAGFEPDAPGFFWLAGQGGYGIQTSPAMGRLGAALIEGRPFPADLAAFGLREAELGPARFRRAAATA